MLSFLRPLCNFSFEIIKFTLSLSLNLNAVTPQRRRGQLLKNKTDEFCRVDFTIYFVVIVVRVDVVL